MDNSIHSTFNVSLLHADPKTYEVNILTTTYMNKQSPASKPITYNQTLAETSGWGWDAVQTEISMAAKNQHCPWSIYQIQCSSDCSPLTT